MVLVAKLLKAPLMSTERTRQILLLRMQLSIMFTRVDNAVSVPFVLQYACCNFEILPYLSEFSLRDHSTTRSMVLK